MSSLGKVAGQGGVVNQALQYRAMVDVAIWLGMLIGRYIDTPVTV